MKNYRKKKKKYGVSEIIQIQSYRHEEEGTMDLPAEVCERVVG